MVDFYKTTSIIIKNAVILPRNLKGINKMSKQYLNDKLVSGNFKSLFPTAPTVVDPEDYTVAEFSSDQSVLSYLLSTKRPYGTEEVTFDAITANNPNAVKYYDKKGDFMFGLIDVPKADNSPITTIFSSHLDTVESKLGTNIIINSVREGKPVVKALNSILGADDAAGVYVMLEMVKRNVSGRYMFFVGEECGSIGSRFAVKEYAHLFVGINRAIAIDRKGTGDVVITQHVGECASPELGLALAEALSFDNDYKYATCTGVFTDTAEMIGLVPECINISAGYYGEHNKQECLDVNYLMRLIEQLAVLDWDALPTVRKPVSARQYNDFDYAYEDYGWKKSYAVDDYYDDYYKDFNASSRKQSKDADIEEVINFMEIYEVTTADIIAYIKRTGYFELL